LKGKEDYYREKRMVKEKRGRGKKKRMVKEERIWFKRKKMVEVEMRMVEEERHSRREHM